MAWRSSGASNRDLVENLWRNELITEPRVKEAFLKVGSARGLPNAAANLLTLVADESADR